MLLRHNLTFGRLTSAHSQVFPLLLQPVTDDQLSTLSWGGDVSCLRLFADHQLVEALVPALQERGSRLLLRKRLYRGDALGGCARRGGGLGCLDPVDLRLTFCQVQRDYIQVNPMSGLKWLHQKHCAPRIVTMERVWPV